MFFTFCIFEKIFSKIYLYFLTLFFLFTFIFDIFHNAIFYRRPFLAVWLFFFYCFLLLFIIQTVGRDRPSRETHIFVPISMFNFRLMFLLILSVSRTPNTSNTTVSSTQKQTRTGQSCMNIFFAELVAVPDPKSQEKQPPNTKFLCLSVLPR